MTFSVKNYFHPTPKVWRKIGDSILIGSTSLSAMMMGAPIPEQAKTWVIFGLNVFGVFGKVISNMFKEEPSDITQ